MLRQTLFLMLGLGLAVGCASAAVEEGDDDMAAATTAKVDNQSGRAFSASELHDPIADSFLHGKGAVPTDFKSAIAKLVADDKKGACDVRIALVSERAQLLGKADAFRAVFTRR